MISPKLRDWIAIAVTIVWILNFVAGFVPFLHYKTDPALHGVFGLIVGGAFALSKDKKDKSDGDDS